MRKSLILIALILLAGCAELKVANNKVAAAPDADIQTAANAVKAMRYKKAVTLYNKIFIESPRPEVAAEALFQIAYLLTIYDNPEKDYAKALQVFDEYIKRFPGQARLEEAESWSFVLRTMLDLKEENESLHRSIEQLKNLDVRHEEKRREK